MSEEGNNKAKNTSFPYHILVLIIAPIAVALIAGGTSPWWFNSGQKDEVDDRPSIGAESKTSAESEDLNTPNGPVIIGGSENTINDSSVNVSGSENVINITKDSEARSRGELDVPHIAGLTYHESRKLLLEEGWIPSMQHWSYKDDINIRYGNGPVFWAQDYTELQACVPTGYGNCSFVFSDPSGRQLTIGTAGMEDPERSIAAIVTGVDLE